MFGELQIGEWMAKNGVKLIFALVILSLVAFGLYQVYDAIYQRGENAKALVDVKQIQVLKDQIEQSNALYQKQAVENSQQLSEWMTKYQKAIQDDQITQNKLKIAAATSSASANGLRQSLNSANAKLSSIATSNPAESAATEYAATVDTLLGQCVDEYRQMAQNADGYAADVRELEEAWPDTSTPPKSESSGGN